MRILVQLTTCVLIALSAAAEEKEAFKIGWISALTGSMSKYCAHESGILAVEEINAAGGVLGRPLELIMEDGRCDAATTISAAKKLIDVNKVDFILGGHCSTSSLALAPIAQRNNVLVVSSISSNPRITKTGDMIFKTSSTSTEQSPLMAEHLVKDLSLKKIAIIYEDTEYAAPIADELKKYVVSSNGEIVYQDSFFSDETDFRSSLVRLKKKRPEAVYIAAQTPDTALLLIKQIKELGIKLPIFGNELVGNTVTLFPNNQYLFDGIIYAEAEFNKDRKETKEFIEHYTKRFDRKTLPYGMWNADAYDAVKILVQTINRCGAKPDKVRDCLFELKNFPGASAQITFDAEGNAKRNFVLKQIRKGEIEELS